MLVTHATPMHLESKRDSKKKEKKRHIYEERFLWSPSRISLWFFTAMMKTILLRNKHYRSVEKRNILLTHKCKNFWFFHKKAELYVGAKKIYYIKNEPTRMNNKTGKERISAWSRTKKVFDFYYYLFFSSSSSFCATAAKEKKENWRCLSTQKRERERIRSAYI